MNSVIFLRLESEKTCLAEYSSAKEIETSSSLGAMKSESSFKKLLTLIVPSFDNSKKIFSKENKRLAFRLCPENFGRALVLTEFITEISKRFSSGSKIQVAVVGGYKTEPEIRALVALGIKCDVTVFGIEENMSILDLNHVNEVETVGFDLILCSQVWEHIWNHEIAFQNLKKLMRKDAFLWLACPASNRAHGSPSYFCAGFTADYFSKNLVRLGLNVISTGQLGTPRNYRATHTLPAWLSVQGHRFPPIGAFSERSLMPRLLFTARYLIATVTLLFVSPKITDADNCATESWVLAKN